MIADVPLGAFLSGGIDSTIIVGLMQQASTRPVQTFSIGFDDPAFDESPYAELAARHFGTEHHAIRVTPRAWETLPALAWQFDEPFADSSALPTWYVAEETRRGVTVALTGDAGDELFAGYDRYRAVALAALLDRLPAPFAAACWAGRSPAHCRSRCGPRPGSARSAACSRPSASHRSIATWAGSARSTSPCAARSTVAELIAAIAAPIPASEADPALVLERAPGRGLRSATRSPARWSPTC